MKVLSKAKLTELAAAARDTVRRLEILQAASPTPRRAALIERERHWAAVADKLARLAMPSGSFGNWTPMGDEAKFLAMYADMADSEI